MKRRKMQYPHKGLRIAFGYEARVGKDTAVDYLIGKYGGHRFSFAKALYDIMAAAQEICGLPKEKDRRFLQIVGTEWGRERDPNIWVNIVVDKIRALREEENIYISDLRFPNEVEALKKEGFTLVHISRPEPERLQVFSNENVGGSTQHASEVALRGSENLFDYHITNDGTLEEFLKKIDLLVSKIQRKDDSFFTYM
jgi:hypothetical protein